MIEFDSPDKFIGTTAAIIMGIAAATSAGTSIYAAHKQSEAAHDASVLTQQAGDKQLDFAKQQAAIDQKNYLDAQAENKRQFDVTQGLNLDQYNQREGRLTPYRDIGVAANGTLSNLLGFTPGSAGGGGASRAMPALDPSAQGKFNSIFPDETLSPDMLKAKEKELNAAGFILRPNAAGVVGKVQYGSDPNAVIDVIQGAGSGVNKRQWLYGPSGGSAAGGGGTLAAFVAPTIAKTATATPQVLTPSLSSALNSPYAASLRSFLTPISA